MRILYVNQCCFTYFLVIFHATRAATHWIVTEDGKIHTQEDSLFQMKRPYDLMSLLQQEKRADEFGKIKNQIIKQKQEIETDSMSEKDDDDVEQLIYMTDPDCIRAGKPLVEFDLYVGTLVFAFPRSATADDEPPDRRSFPRSFPVQQLHTSTANHHHYQFADVTAGSSHSLSTTSPLSDSLVYEPSKTLFTVTCANTSDARHLPASFEPEAADSFDGLITRTNAELIAERAKSGPNCSEHLALDFSMTTFEHLPSIQERKQLTIDPEKQIHRILGKWSSYQQFGADISAGLKQNSSSWLLYTLASFYWRGAGKAEQAIECVRRALHTSPYEYRPIPLLSLATILHRARAFEEAAIVLHGAIDITPDIPHAHYTLGNIYATLADYNKSVICYENVLKLAPTFDEVRTRKAAVRCHSSVEAALKAQHDTLERTLEELKDYQRQQELWINYHKKLRAEQAQPSVLIEQRLHYHEFKIRQKLDESNQEFGQMKSTKMKAAADDNGEQLQQHSPDVTFSSSASSGKWTKTKLKSDNLGENSAATTTTTTTTGDDKLVIDFSESCSDEAKAKAIVAGVRSSKNREEAQDSITATNSNANANTNTAAASNEWYEMEESTGPNKVSNECRSNGGDSSSLNGVETTDSASASGGVGGGDSSSNSRPMLIPVTFVLPPS